MKLARLILVVALLAVSASLAFADSSNDPGMKLGPGGDAIVLTSDTFSFTASCAAATCTETFDFINGTGAVIDELDLYANSTLDFYCDNSVDTYFQTCSPMTSTPGPTTIRFYGVGDGYTGIPYALLSQISCPESYCGYETNSDCYTSVSGAEFAITVEALTRGESFTVDGTLLPAPEPSTLLMLLAAAVGYLVLKRSSLHFST